MWRRAEAVDHGCDFREGTCRSVADCTRPLARRGVPVGVDRPVDPSSRFLYWFDDGVHPENTVAGPVFFQSKEGVFRALPEGRLEPR